MVCSFVCKGGEAPLEEACARRNKLICTTGYLLSRNLPGVVERSLPLVRGVCEEKE
jgi:hypothetical protein